MTLTLFAPQDDLPQLADGGETVALTWPDGRLQTISAAVRAAVRRRPHAQSSGEVSTAQTAWHLPACLAAPPTIGLLITDAAGEQWLATAVTLAAGGSRWVVHAQQVTIPGGLSDRVHLQTALLSKDAHGGQRIQWRTVAVHWPASVQPLATSHRAADGTTSAAQFRVLLIPSPRWAAALRQRPLRVVQRYPSRRLHVASAEQADSLAGLVVLLAEAT
jgi:hypothetical protein